MASIIAIIVAMSAYLYKKMAFANSLRTFFCEIDRISMVGYFYYLFVQHLTADFTLFE
jgi:hypothetical protein